jgi:hypothetical protein
MSIFDGVEKSAAQKRYEMIKEKAPLLKSGEENRCKSAFYDMWGAENNPISREVAAELLALFGTDAVSLFTHHAAWQNFVATVNPSWERLTPPYELDFHEDGSVTLKPEAEPTQPEENK